jgi:triacylglycerol esterase/lipase EstA (alpha/beta hydrolase family)
VVTISSPHHGTEVAGLAAGLTPDACPVGCQQLAPDSDLLRRLNAGDETPAGPAWVSVWSADDETVTPPESAVLDGALDVRVQDLCPEAILSHGQMPRAPAVVRVVVDALESPVVSAPTSSVCPRG